MSQCHVDVDVSFRLPSPIHFILLLDKTISHRKVIKLRKIVSHPFMMSSSFFPLVISSHFKI